MSQKVICLCAFVLLSIQVIPCVANAVDPDLVCWWKLDGDATDSSGHGINGTLSGGPQWVVGYYDGALELDGTDDYVDFGNPSILPSGASARTVCGWGFIDGTIVGGWHWIAAYGSPAQAQATFIGVNGDTMRIAVGAGWGDQPVGWNQAAADNCFWVVGEWHHICLTYDGTTAKLYADGALVTSEAKTWNTVLRSAYIGQQVSPGQRWDGLVDDVRIYSRALTEAEIRVLMKGEVGLASKPHPSDGATDVPRDVVLNWTPGQFASTHDVYLGTVFDDANNASRSNPLGLLASQGQAAATYDPPGRLDFGQTYFWRVDEVNAPPTSTIFKGDVWSFTVEPLAYLIDANSIRATASSSNRADEGPENTVNGSGLDGDDMHSAINTDMWLSSITGPQPTWIQYEFDKAYKLHQMWVWNYNSSTEPVIGFGVKEATIEYSTDGANWTTLGTTHEFARAPGVAGYAPNTTVDLGGVAAKYVKITANSNWGGLVQQYGLSEVRFSYIPVSAREPDPASGTTNVSVDATLSWRTGREAAKHDVYLSTDEQAVIDGTAPSVTVTSPTYTSSLDLASTYYWRIDEVNEAETPSAWQGDIWSLSTQEYLAVDDFESYNDIEAGQEDSHLVYETWIDGFGTTTNGSTIGYTEAFQPSMEKTVIYDGKQSVPLFYNNTTASVSEVTANVADLQAGHDWTEHGIKGLTLRFSGDPNNAAQQMYVKINGAKVIYDGDAENLRRPAWQMWYIDLASLGVNPSNVTTLTIGLERIGAAGGQGMVLLDGIRLYSYERPLITPAAPGTANLVGDWPLDGNPSDISGNKYDGVAEGDVTYAQGVVGSAADFNGSNALVNCGDVPILGGGSTFSIALWVNPRDIAQNWAGIVSKWTPDNTSRTFWLGQHSTDGWLRFSIYPGGPTAETPLDSGSAVLTNGAWTHIVCTYDGNIQRIYADGVEVVASPPRNAAITDRGGNLRFGTVSTANWLNGLIDDVRIYSRALSPAEIAGLAGVTKPFDKPF